ncbi:MAG: hypothetical protein PHC56_13120 [Herbinix sp.]|nr:hypothetical protein [Herbinix sp.]
MRKKNEGMSFIELVLIIVIIAILSTGGIAIYNSLGYAKTKKAANHINDSLSKARIETMSKKGIQYLYLYQIGGKPYSKLSPVEALSIGVYGELTAAEGMEYSPNITLKYKTDTGASHELGDNESICLSFVKSSGAFASNYSEIILESGNDSSTIRCIKETGRHWIYN